MVENMQIFAWLCCKVHNVPIVLKNFSVSEYEALDLELDQLNSCLDKLENWNDSLQSRMKDMLETMQKTRVERQLQMNGKSSDSDTQDAN